MEIEKEGRERLTALSRNFFCSAVKLPRFRLPVDVDDSTSGCGSVAGEAEDVVMRAI